MLSLKEKIRIARHKRSRQRIRSSAKYPRLCIHRSYKNIYIQAIDDKHALTLFSLSTLNKEIKEKIKYGGNITAAGLLGQVVADKLKQKGITKVVFDRGGYLYHGRIKAFAEGLRKAGIII